jgi:hypothetical protein
MMRSILGGMVRRARDAAAAWRSPGTADGVSRHRVDIKRAKKDRAITPEAIARLEDEVRATYVRHDRELSNPESRALMAGDPPRLDATQQEVLAALEAEGIAVIPFARLFGDALWPELLAESAAFEARMQADTEEPEKRWKKGDAEWQAAMAREAAGVRAISKKSFLRRAGFGRDAVVPLDHPWLRLAASPRILDIANSRRGLWTKLTEVDQIYVTPVGAEMTRVSSQRWHRDFNDQPVIKVFIYMSDVDEGAGPFEYVPGSSQGRYAQEWPWGPLGDMYPEPAEFERRIPASAMRSITGPAGTMIFCETNGFHRGGFARNTRRITSVFHYVSPASLASLVSRDFLAPEVPEDAPAQVRFALT